MLFKNAGSHISVSPIGCVQGTPLTRQRPIAGDRDISRRSVLRSGTAALVGGPLARGAAARAATLPTFSRGINAWPWLVMPLADPPVGAPYADWPPYNPNRPVPTRSDLAALSSARFDFIRLAVDPAPFLNTAEVPASDQFERLFDVLLGAIREANAAGLGVIVNIQPGGSPRWAPDRLYGRNADPATFEAFVRFIATLAHRLGQLSMPRLALEPVNEPSQDSSTIDGAADWNRKQSAILAAARSQTKVLALVATGASGSGPRGLQAIDPEPLIARFEPLLFTFHFYEPYLFSHQGAPWAAVGSQLHYRWLNDVPWPAATGSLKATLAAVKARMAADPLTTSEQKDAAYTLITRVMTDYFDGNVDRHYLTAFLDGVSDWAARHGVGSERIVMGEFGALKSTTDRLDTWDAPPQSVTGGPYVAARAADRLRYLGDVRVTAEEHGFGWALWTLFNPGMGLITSDTRHSLDPDVLAALGLTVP